MLGSRDSCVGARGVVDVAFTDRHGGVSDPPYDSLDLSRARLAAGSQQVAHNYRLVAEAMGVPALAYMRMEHGARVVEVTGPGEADEVCDALVTTTPGVALAVSVADCVPVLLADADAGVLGAAHAGRPGMVAGVVPATIDRMRRLGAEAITAWVGPCICGGCYEVPEQMRAEVSAAVPTAYAVTTWGTPAVDIGAGVVRQLVDAGCTVRDHRTCTRESSDLYSYRRDGDDSGRFAGLVVLREERSR